MSDVSRETQQFEAPTLEEALDRLAMPMVEAMRTQRAVRRLHPCHMRAGSGRRRSRCPVPDRSARSCSFVR